MTRPLVTTHSGLLRSVRSALANLFDYRVTVIDMKRRSFLAFLGAFPFRAGPPGKRAQPETDLVVHECFVAGLRFHGGWSAVSRVRAGDGVGLVAEPSNHHDPFAVRVEHGGDHIGYLPREQNQTIARLLTAGRPIRATITRVRADGPLWQAVGVEVKLGE
ncbi:MAG: HIRAN domain-containing protein [Gemmatimonadota bacterium]